MLLLPLLVIQGQAILPREPIIHFANKACSPFRESLRKGKRERNYHSCYARFSHSLTFSLSVLTTTFSQMRKLRFGKDKELTIIVS